MQEEMARQGIEDYQLWPAIFVQHKPRCIGINAAHKQIVRYAKENNLPEILIFEDDVRFPAKDGFQYYLSKKPDDFDLYIGGVYRGDLDENGVTQKFTALHCYIIKQKFYDTFLNTRDDIDIDHALTGLGKFVVCYPFAAIQYNGWSDHSWAEMNYDTLLTGKEIYGLDSNLKPVE